MTNLSNEEIQKICEEHEEHMQKMKYECAIAEQILLACAFCRKQEDPDKQPKIWEIDRGSDSLLYQARCPRCEMAAPRAMEPNVAMERWNILVCAPMPRQCDGEAKP